MHRRMLGNGYCARPVGMDCHFESICESCTFFQTTIEFRPTLQRQRDDAEAKGRQKIFDGLLARLDENACDCSVPASMPSGTWGVTSCWHARPVCAAIMSTKAGIWFPSCPAGARRMRHNLGHDRRRDRLLRRLARAA